MKSVSDEDLGEIKNKKRYDLGVIFCMAAIVLIYAIVLFRLPSCAAHEAWLYEGRCGRYLFNIIKMGFMSWLLIGAFKSWLVEGRKRIGFAFLAGAFVVSMFGTSYGSLIYLQYHLQRVFIVIWPVLMIVFSLYIQKMENKLTQGKYGWGVISYYIIVTVAIWFATEILAYSESFKREIPDIVYLLGCAVLAWHIGGKYINKKMENCVWKKIYSCFEVILPVCSFGILMMNHERLTEISNSLSNPITNIQGVQHEVNWLGNRIALMKQAWLGTGGLLEFEIENSIYGGSLVTVHQVLGWIATVAVIVMEIVLIYFCYKMYQSKKTENACTIWMQMAFYTILFWNVLGFCADIFVISSSRISLILLDNVEIFAMVLFYLYLMRSPVKEGSRKG